MGNEVSGASHGGIVIEAGADNRVRDNRVHDSQSESSEAAQVGDGIFVGPFTTAIVVRGNTVSANPGDGIEVQGVGTRIGGNSATGNGDFGIDAVSGVTDIGGNTASGNGNPLQCRNVFCAAPYGWDRMSDEAGALALAEAQVAAVRDDPAARLALMARVFRGPTGRAPRHLPFRRAALSFMRWQARRGVLDPLDASPPGSVWWRAVNERLLRDGCETIALLGGSAGEPSSQAVRLWLEFGASPTGRNWYRAHNASIVAAYLEHRNLADAEGAPERFFMNVALVRVLYAHALAGAPRLALGRFAPLGRVLGDPRLGMAGAFLSLRRVLPNRYPLALDVDRYIAEEQRLGRMLDYAVIVPRLQSLYEWSAEELGEPRLLGLVRHGNPIYAWPFEQRHVWRTPSMPFAGRVLERVTRAR